MPKYKTPPSVRRYQREKSKARTLALREKGLKYGRIVCRVGFEEELRKIAIEDIKKHGLAEDLDDFRSVRIES